MRKNPQKTAVISFRLPHADKEKLDQVVSALNSNKSDFFRKRTRTFLLTIFKNCEL